MSLEVDFSLVSNKLMWFVRDGCGIACCVLTYAIMLTVSGLTYKVSVRPLADEEYLSAFGCVFGYVILLGLAGLSHFICVVTNPGTLTKHTASHYA